MRSEEGDEKEMNVSLNNSHDFLSPRCPRLPLSQLPSVSSSLFGVGESFSSFSTRLHKSAHLLAAELFGTQLRMIRGVSASLALNIIARYPSARALCEAYQQCENQDEEERLLQDVARGPFQ